MTPSRTFTRLSSLGLLAIFLCGAPYMHATDPAAPSSELYKKIAELDQRLFDAFNACDMATMRSLMEPSVEFYQDNDETTYSREQLEPSNRERCAPNNVSKLRRELIPGTMEVYPLQNYGALQIARHNFFIMNGSTKGKLAASPRMVHIWRNDHGHWAVSRIISYGH
ncbi:MAG: nuclear transport factor 2 family protein [Candidatus Sulfotelmatobacter sp.]